MTVGVQIVYKQLMVFMHKIIIILHIYPLCNWPFFILMASKNLYVRITKRKYTLHGFGPHNKLYIAFSHQRFAILTIYKINLVPVIFANH